MTGKKQLSCRVSDETYNEVMKLIGDDSPFKSTSEYIYTLVLKDLGERKNGATSYVESIKDALQSDEVKALIKDIIAQQFQK